MTTQVSQQTQAPPQASSSTSASTLSYASTAKKAVSPAIADGAGSAAVQQHAKANSISLVNGRPSVSPAVPAVAAPAIAHSSSAANGGSADHSRKSSVTMSANGPGGFVVNGGPVGGSKNGIQFGNFTDSPAPSHSTPQISQSAASAPIAIPSNPRVTAPAKSPSPIPQPSASGGRPPSGLAPSGTGAPIFGSLGGDGEVSLTLRFMHVHVTNILFAASHATSVRSSRSSGTWTPTWSSSTRVYSLRAR